MKKSLTPDKLLELVKSQAVKDGDEFKFIDNHRRRWKAGLMDELIVADDSIPENSLTDDDYEEVPRCDLICLDDCYLQFSAYGDNYIKALLQCFSDANLIDEQRGLVPQMPDE